MTRILIIEDDEAIANLERDYLELNGYQVDVCHDGTLGLEMALTGVHDLFIIDIMLPGRDGFEICKEIRKISEVPLLMVSAKKEDIDKIRGLGLGADDYITKPFSPGELVARVGAHLARYSRIRFSPVDESGEIVEIRGLRIDRATHSVTVNGNGVKLTGREFELLEFFATHPGVVYSKQDLFREIWNSESIGDSATVTVHVKKLREKIEVDPAKPQYIETIWGVGYRFKV